MPGKRYFKLFIIVFFILGVSFAQRFSIKHYTPQNGPKDQRTLDALQFSDGKMAFLHKRFISIYDGVEWNYLEPESKLHFDFLKFYNYKNDQIILGANLLWGKTFIIKNGVWNELQNDNLDKNFFTELGTGHTQDFVYSEKNGKLILAKCDEISVFYYNGNWSKIQLPGKVNPRIFNLKFIGNSLYISTSNGYYIFDGKNISQIKPKDLGAKSNKVISISDYSDNINSNQIWVLSDTWLGYLEGQKLTIVSEFAPLPIFNIGINLFFLKIYKNDIFFGNQNTICYLEKSNWQFKTLSMEKGLITDGATKVFQDREKNLWFPTYRGINKLRRRAFLIYKKENGLLENEVTAIDELNNGNLVFGYNSGVGIYDNSFTNIPFTKIPENSGSFRRVFDIKADHNKAWFAATTTGVGKLTGKKVEWFKSKEKRFFYCIEKDYDQLLIGTFEGLVILKNGRFFRDEITYKKKYYIKKIVRYDEKSFLLATNNGVVLYDKNSVEEINPEVTSTIYSFHQVGEKEFLVGTTTGLYRLKNKKLEKVRFGKYSIEDDIYFINNDHSGNLWFGTSNGVYIWTGTIMHHLNTEQGLPHNETNRDAGFCDSKGNFWVGTARGLVKFEKLPEPIDTVKPLLMVNEFEDFSGEIHKFENVINRNFYDNSFSLLLKGISFIDEEKLEYEISILEHRTNKKNTFRQKENKFRLSNLASGDYTFTVKVKNFFGVWSDTKTIQVNIDKPYYKQIWFVFILFIIVVMFVLLVQNNFNQKKYSEKLLEEVESRTKSLQISNKKYRIISETIDEVIWSFDSEFNLDYVSPTVKKLFGYSIESIERLEKSKPIIERLCEKFEEFNLEKIKREIISSEFKYSEGPNKNRFFEIYTSPIINNDNFLGVIGVTREISQRIAKERVKNAAIVQTIEKERTRIARDLHDHLGQILASIKLRLEMYQLRSNEDPDIEEAYNQLTIVKTELKNIIEDLNPLPYGRTDLVEALQDLCSSYRRKKDSSVNIKFASNVNYIEHKDEERLLIFRIAQEAITNAIVHSQATEISLQLISTGKNLILSIIDNGIGFDQIESKKTSGFGFQNMRQRAAILEGELHIDSNKDKGTKIILKI